MIRTGSRSSHLRFDAVHFEIQTASERLIRFHFDFECSENRNASVHFCQFLLVRFAILTVSMRLSYSRVGSVLSAIPSTLHFEIRIAMRFENQKAVFH